MKKLLLSLWICLLIVPLALTQATPTPEGVLNPSAPYSTWTGGFKIKAGAPFVWLRATPFAGAEILGTLFPSQTLQAVEAPNGDSQILETAFAQWWGYFAAGNLRGWIELAAVEPIVVATPTTDITDAANWQVTNIETIEVQIASSIPFAWVRSAADSDSSIARTLFSGARLLLTGEAVPDAFQLWWPVQELSSGTVGFVEQQSLRYVRRVAQPNALVNPSTWAVATVVRVKSSVPFVWVRQEAVSTSGFVATLLKGREMIIASGPTDDGTGQLWWQVIVPNTPFSGWVEETSLEKVR